MKPVKCIECANAERFDERGSNTCSKHPAELHPGYSMKSFYGSESVRDCEKFIRAPGFLIAQRRGEQ